jgi:starvation-inducible DNA-binding protein
MHLTRNTLSEPIRMRSASLLNKHLAAAIDLQGQAKQAHWNVRGPAFIAVHTMFDAVAEEIAKIADLLAERIGALGGTAHGTVQTATEHSFLIPYDLGIGSENEHVFAVAGALAAFGQSVQDAIANAASIGDATSADLLTEISRTIDQQLWLVEAHVPPDEVFE